MKFKKSLFLLAFAMTNGLILFSAHGAQFVTKGGTQGGTGEINITADKLSTGNGTEQIEASGNVEIKREGMTLRADDVRMNRVTQDVDAKGKISVDDPEWKLKSADTLQLNLEKETGVIQNGDIFLEEGHLSMSGRRFEKFGGQTYHVDDGFFTTCLCDSGSPSWKFSAEQMDLMLEGTGTVKNGYFYILDVPVMYIPYGFFPLRTDRQTGFLFPSVGHSTKEGFRYLQPFFWALSKSTDATFNLDVESLARIGFIGEFRTKFDRDSDFSLQSSYFNENLRKNAQDAVVDRTIADQDIPKNRWSLIGTHRYSVGADWLTYSDFAVYRDDLFARELVDRFDLPGTQEQDIRRSRYGSSRFGLFKNWGDTFFKSEMNFYQDFIQPDNTTLQRTPQLTFWGRRLLSGFPLEFRWRAEGVNYLRREGGDGLRLDLRPEIVLPFSGGRYFDGSLNVAPRETAYHLYSPVKSNDRNITRELVEIRGHVGTSLSRVFNVNSFGLNSVKHVIEPELSYLFIPGINQSNIPIMDNIDRINRRNVVTFALANRVWGKTFNPLIALPADQNTEYLNPMTTGAVRELATLRLALGYDIDKARKGGDSLTDLDIHFEANPLGYLVVGFDSGVDPGKWKLTQLRTSVSMADPRPLPRRSLDPDFNRPNSIGLSYQIFRLGDLAYLAEDANIDLDTPATVAYCAAHTSDPRCPGSSFNKNVGGALGTNLLYHLMDNVLVTANSTYDALNSRFIGFRTATKILSTCECWSLTLGLNHDINPAKTSFNVNFSLLGLGAQKSSLK